MDPNEWRLRCSARLHAQWPSLTREQRDEVAGELWAQPRWCELEPEAAARFLSLMEPEEAADVRRLLIYDDARQDDGGAVASLVAGVA